MVGTVAAFLLVYFALVRTSAGQRAENEALHEMALGGSWMGSMSTVVAVTAVLVVLLGRRRCLPALVVLGGSVGLSQVLKLSVLDRPLLDETASLVHNSFPSGHVTAALASVVALVMVLPRRIAPFAGVAGALVAAQVAAETVTLGWHRFSDTAGASLLVATLCCLALRAWFTWFLAPVVVASLGVYLMTWGSVPTPLLAAASTFAVACYCVLVVSGWGRRNDPNHSRSGSALVEVGGDDLGDRFESSVRTVPVGGEHHLVTMHCAERHQSENARSFHGVVAVLPDGDLHRLVGGGLRQQGGRSCVQSDLAGHGDPSLRHDPSSR